MLFLGLLGCLPLAALTVESTPGALRSLIDDPAAVADLAVEGQIDASDLYFIGSELPALRSLDLSKAMIAAYEGPSINHSGSYPAAIIPPASLAGLQIESIVLPASLAAIADGAFAGTALASVDIPADISLGHGAFAGCPALARATVGSSSIGEGAFANCPALVEVALEAPSIALSANAFTGCEALTTVDGSANISSIGPRAFAGCKSLEDFAFGSSLQAIGDEAFAGSGLAAANLSECTSLPSVGRWAFAGCKSLASVDLGQAVPAEGAFFDCPALQEFQADAMTVIPSYAFAKNAQIDTTGIFTDRLASIGSYALSHVAGATVITLPATLTSIGMGAMEYMTALNTINATSPTPPALGSNVWEGVDVASATLYVPAQAADAYREAEQWQDFAIVEPTVNGSADISADILPGLRARFVAKELQIGIQDLEIASLSLFDPSGRLLIALEPNAELVAVDTSAFANDIFILVASLSDGRRATLKISR